MKNSPGKRKDPYMAYNFVVEIEGIQVAQFSEVSGLSVETQVEKKNFGGENHREYTFLAQTKYSDITLKRGLMDDLYLWKWYQKVIDGKCTGIRRNASIYLLDDCGNPLMWWDVLDACPIKWEGPALNASSSAVAVETLVLTHNGIHMHK
ncbi:phage tail protein [Ruminiclostridium herbifermentans]|uniref:Phage tail protein n=2 Tax=Ruminiclostridium herbifermentans TaxID=2488810 RepID=A0A4U7JE23_9FIRM|nr:phage tail protein [Ruminiclostridium herbifermentans]